MIIKKTLVLTSSLLLSATMLSQVYSYANTRFQSRTIDYSAFTNFRQNINSLSSTSSQELISREDTAITNEIIALIGKEIGKKISNTKYALNSYKTKHEKLPTRVAALELKTSEELSSYEINNSQLINLYGLSVEQMAYIKFESTKLATTYNEVVKDEVVVAQASTEVSNVHQNIQDEVKIIQPSAERKETPEEKPEEKNDEMVVFDYSNMAEPVSGTVAEKKIMDEKLYERPLSSTVKEAISRELSKSPTEKIAQAPAKKELLNTVEIDDQKIELESEENIVYDYSKNKPEMKGSPTKENEIESAISAFTNPAKAEEQNTQFTIKAKEINLNTHRISVASAFEFVPDYERGDRADDQASGEINFGYSLNGKMNTQTGVIQARDVITTRVELNLGLVNGIEIPLINEEGMQQFLINQGLAAEGNLILLSLDSSVVDTEIDSKFDQRFYFDRTFKLLTNNTDASYVMYAGVKNGNIMIRYLLDNKESAQKIVYVGEGEMYFERASFIKSNRETYTLTTRNLLGQKNKELIIDGNAISFFNTNHAAKKKALNAYEIKVPTMASGMRKYLEFKHLKNNIFVGTSGQKEIEIPSNEFIAKVLEMNEVDALKERCVVQLNLSKDIREMKVSGKNKSGEMYIETNFLDKDGNFSKDSEMSEKAFIVGDMEGQFGVRFEYTDGSSEFLKTFCSEGTYLVEQL